MRWRTRTQEGALSASQTPEPPMATRLVPMPGGQCEYAGHSWTDAGGGLLICAVCETEKWADPPAAKDDSAA